MEQQARRAHEAAREAREAVGREAAINQVSDALCCGSVGMNKRSSLAPQSNVGAFDETGNHSHRWLGRYIRCPQVYRN